MLRKLVTFMVRVALMWAAGRWRTIAIFMVYEFVGVALVWTAYLLPHRRGPEIPALLFLVGIMSCFTGLGHGLSLFPGTRAASFHHWTGRVSPPTWGKEAAVWVVKAPARKQTGDGVGESGGSHGDGA